MKAQFETSGISGIVNFNVKPKVLDIALTQFGIKEIPGKVENNPMILNYFHEIGQEWVKNDEYAWCSAFVNWCCLKAGLETSGKLTARSWLKIGKKVLKPQMGDIVVLWRVSPKSWKGHVGFFIKETKDLIYILGGNQDNQVSIKAYPKERLLDIRRLDYVE